ncbi:MAG: hypothetical protein ABR574_00700, partial [Cryomorphaceae bacterium]
MRLFPVLLGLLFALFAEANEPAKWLRYPAISPDGETIAFTYKGNIYTVPSAGGNATQLTTREAHDYMPVWSKDGNRIAFASDRYGNFDVFVMPVRGGAATRLSYHSADEHPYTFSADGANVIFGAARLDAADHRNPICQGHYENPTAQAHEDSGPSKNAQNQSCNRTSCSICREDVVRKVLCTVPSD